MIFNRFLISASVGMALLAAGPASAQQGQSTADEVNRLINELDRRPTQTPDYRQRVKPTTLRVRPDIGRQDIYVTNAAIREIPVVLNYNHSEDFTINFRFDSFQLTREARATLDVLGEALSSTQLQDDVFLVGGHTDTVGKDDYNQWLSERRAYEVVAYLIDVWNITADRLQPVGFGETELKDPRAGANKINRRVEFTIIEPESATPVANAGPGYGSDRQSGADAPIAAAPVPDVTNSSVPRYQIPSTPSNVVCDTRTTTLSGPRPPQQGIDDFAAGRSPAECLDTARQGTVSAATPQQDEAVGTGGAASAIDDVNNAIGN